MEINEAIDILDSTLGMFSFFADEIENGDLKEKFLLTPVYTSIENFYNEKNEFVSESRAYFNYVDGGKEYKRYIVDVRPVCSCVVNEWPSYKAKFIRKFLKEDLFICLDYCKGKLDDNMMSSALEEGYNYHRRYNKDSHYLLIIETIMLDIIHEMSHALGVTEDIEPEIEEKTERPKRFTESLLEEIKDLKEKINQLTQERGDMNQLDGSDSVPEQAFNAKTNVACFTSAQMGILMEAVGNLIESPAPGKSTLGAVVEKISGYKAKTVNQNMKGTHREADKETVAKAIEDKFPKLAAKVRKL